MTDEQIKAIFQGCGDYMRRWGMVDGVRFITNGYVLFPSAAEIDGRELYSIAKRWREEIKPAASAVALTTVEYYTSPLKEHYRVMRIGAMAVHARESYLRMVRATEWRFRALNKPLLGMRDSRLVGLVMPTKNLGELARSACGEPSDEVLVAEFACAENGWADASGVKMRARVAELESEISDARRRRSELEAEINEWEKEGDELKRRIREKVPC